MYVFSPFLLWVHQSFYSMQRLLCKMVVSLQIIRLFNSLSAFILKSFGWITTLRRHKGQTGQTKKKKITKELKSFFCFLFCFPEEIKFCLNDFARAVRNDTNFRKVLFHFIFFVIYHRIKIGKWKGSDWHQWTTWVALKTKITK